MATVSEDLARKVIASEGFFEDDPRVMQVVSYTSTFGYRRWAVLYARDVVFDHYAPSRFVINPKIEWAAK